MSTKRSTLPGMQVHDLVGVAHVVVGLGKSNFSRPVKVMPERIAFLAGARLANFVNEDGSIYVMSPTGPIKRLSPDGILTDFAGVPNPVNGEAIDGPLATARFQNPQAMTRGPDDNERTLYVADGNSIRVIKNGQVTTLAGHVINFDDDDDDYGVIIDANDIWNKPGKGLFFWDEDRLRSVTLDGKVTTIARPPKYDDPPDVATKYFKYCNLHIPNAVFDSLGNQYYSKKWALARSGRACNEDPEFHGYIKMTITNGEETCIKGPDANTFTYDFRDKILYFSDDTGVWREGGRTPRLWQGFARAEIDFFNGVMAVLPPAPNPDVPDTFDPNRANFSFCPVCLGYATRESGCMYMHHVCPASKRHPELYGEYANPVDGQIEWCTVCGRICKGHGHILRNMPEDRATGRVPYPPGVVVDFFGNDCFPYGGGGATEKFVRMEQMAKAACEAIESVGRDTEDSVRKTMIEKIWRGVKPLDDPALYQAATARMAHPIEVPCELPAVIAQPARAAVHVRRPADEAAMTPTKHVAPDNRCAVELNEPQHEGKPVYQFHHKQPDGTIWNHENEYICAEDLQAYIVQQNSDVFTGLCPLNDHCKARLYPEEIEDIIEASVWKRYQEKFDEHFAEPAAMAGGGRSSGIFYKIDPSEIGCLLPPKKKAGRRTYRKKQKKTRGKSRARKV